MKAPNTALPHRLPPRIYAIISEAGERYMLTVPEMLEGGRSRNRVTARAVAAKAMRDLGMSLSDIGRRLRCHHSTVHYMLHLPRLRHPQPPPPPVAESIPCPDYSGEWAI